MPFLECAGGDGRGLIASGAALRGSARAGVLDDCNAAEHPMDVLCACGTVLDEGRLSPSHRPSGLVGRVLESGHTAGEPIVAEQNLHAAQGEAGTAADGVFMGADNARRVASLAGRAVVAKVGDVAARGGRGVAGFVG
ncbi:MAG TPA: hypothetical protein VGF91_27660 [Solirubrobacteraceae bacterium]|jgi:hypothetical protein